MTNDVYTERAHLAAALSKLYPASLEEHAGEDWDDNWRTVLIVDLPTGQVSWHIAQHDLHLFAHLPRGAGRVWDGHDTVEKYRRLDALPNALAYTDAVEPYVHRLAAIDMAAHGYGGDIPEHFKSDPLVVKINEMHTCWQAVFHAKMADFYMQKHIQPLIRAITVTVPGKDC